MFEHQMFVTLGRMKILFENVFWNEIRNYMWNGNRVLESTEELYCFR